MTDLLVRGVDPAVVKHLKARARLNGRSLQAELRALLSEPTAPTYSKAELTAMIEKWRRRFAGRVFPDSAESIREDRAR